jgi:hypothetical protein
LPNQDGALKLLVIILSMLVVPGEAAARLRWHTLAQELSRWQVGSDWNSRLRIGQVRSGPEMALYLTNARRFGVPRTGHLPPQALIDGTGDKELLALLFEMVIPQTGDPRNGVRNAGKTTTCYTGRRR